MLILEEAAVRSVLTPERCMEGMRKVLRDLAEGKCAMPDRLICRMPNTAMLGFMPAYVGDYYGAKVIAAYAPNMGTEYPSHIGYVMLFESVHSTVAAMVEAGSITEIRTGCVSAIATDLLARKDAGHLGIIGCGAQARSHFAAISRIRNIRQVSVYDLRREAAERFAEEVRGTGIPVTIADSVAEAVRDADIICTLTPAKKAYLTREMVKPGAHINAVGTFTPTTREVDSDLVAASRLYGDYAASTRTESGEYLIPLQEGKIQESHLLGDLGGLLTGKTEGRRSDSDITLFDALGLAVEDVESAKMVYLAVQ